MYIHELANWPHFLWDQTKFSDLLIELRHKQGRLIGAMESVGFPARDEASLEVLTEDVIKSSAIEGEILDPFLVRSSVARHLGMEVAGLSPPDKNVEGVVEMMLDATQNFKEPLTKERLFNWHKSLFPKKQIGAAKMTVVAWRRGRVQVISGKIGNQTVHFEAPPAAQVDQDMALFLDWVGRETNIDPVLKSAIAHLWFVTIHPFDDGNGRIGRAITDLLLARSENSPRRFYSLSAQIQAERKGYYAILERTQKGTLDITPWIEWFFNCLKEAIEDALSTLDMVLYKTQFWEALTTVPLSERQRKMLNRLLDGFDGKLTSSKWAKMTKCSQDTAHRDILDLIERGILTKDPGGGRSTSYSLTSPAPCAKKEKRSTVEKSFSI